MTQAPPEAKEARVKLGSLEIGRFIAALMVMLSHTVPYVNGHAANPAAPLFGGLLFPGPLGVQYFFVLSGFVMASAHYHDFGKLSAVPMFWWRRACRIYPAYWLALCIPALYLLGASTFGRMLHLALLDPWHGQEYIPAAWSMRYEMAFYIMFGLCLLPYIGKPLLAFWMFFTLWRYGTFNIINLHPPFLYSVNRFAVVHGDKFVDVFEFYFFAGLVAGLAYAGLRPGPRLAAVLLAAAALLLVFALPNENWGREYGLSPLFRLGMACTLAGCVLGLASLERHGIIHFGKYAAWLGAMSYPLYIFHEPVTLIINNTLPWGQHHTLGLYARLIAITTAILAVSALVTFAYDQPVQRLLRRLTRRVVKRPGALPLDPTGAVGPRPLDLMD
jgi:peptidoglycan/LPS O-acetylase OafA/YrhL